MLFVKFGCQRRIFTSILHDLRYGGKRENGGEEKGLSPASGSRYVHQFSALVIKKKNKKPEIIVLERIRIYFDL